MIFSSGWGEGVAKSAAAYHIRRTTFEKMLMSRRVGGSHSIYMFLLWGLSARVPVVPSSHCDKKWAQRALGWNNYASARAWANECTAIYSVFGCHHAAFGLSPSSWSSCYSNITTGSSSSSEHANIYYWTAVAPLITVRHYAARKINF